MIVGSWGLYPWFVEHGEEFIKLEYRDEFLKLQPYGKLFFCVGKEEEFIVLKYNTQQFLVNPKLFIKVPSPKFAFGDKVSINTKPEVVGTICDINWHYKNQEELYFIEVDKNKKKSRYLKEELIHTDK